MDAAENHANDVHSGWSITAFQLLERFAREAERPFTCEVFRAWAGCHGLVSPPDARAFGGVTQRAIRNKVIRRVGFAPAASSRGSAKPLYARSA